MKPCLVRLSVTVAVMLASCYYVQLSPSEYYRHRQTVAHAPNTPLCYFRHEGDRSSNGSNDADPPRIKSLIFTTAEAFLLLEDGTAKILDLKTWSNRQTLTHKVGEFLPMPSNRRILTTTNFRIQMWRYEKGNPQITKDWKTHEEPLTAVAYTSDEKTIATANGDAIARLWDVESGELKGRLIGHKAAINALTFSPNGRIIVTGSDDCTVRVWDVETCREIAQLEGHGGSIRCIQYNPSGQMFAYAGRDQVIRLCNAEDGSEIRQLRGHNRSVNCLAFSPDGRILLSGGNDKDYGLRAWNVSSGTMVDHLTKHISPVTRLSWMKRGDIFAVIHDNERLILFDVKNGEAMSELKNRIEAKAKD